MEKIKFHKQVIFEYFLLALGSAIMALGIGIFLVDAKVVPGGVSGLSMAIHYLTNQSVPVGMLMWALNVPLFWWGIHELGKTFAFRTFFSFTLNSIFIDLFRGDIPGLRFIRFQDHPAVQELLKQDFFFLILLGSVLLGVGLGIIFKFKGTTAGSDIVASIMQKRWGMKPGQAIMIIDFFVITGAGLIIGLKGLSVDKNALTLTLYAFFLLFVSSKLIDIIIDGFDYARAAFIMSNKPAEIGDAIINNMRKGATAFKTRGLYLNIDREVIYTVVSIRDMPKLMDIVKSIDPDAFVTIQNVHEVLGEGFRRRI